MSSLSTSVPAPALHLDGRGITRLFGDTVALWDVSVEADAGDLVEVLGPNGSGKSTLLRVMAGLLRPDRGRVRWDPPDQARRIAYVGHKTQLFEGLTARETLILALRLRGGDPGASSATLERHGVAHVADLPVSALSAGTRRRLAIARAVTSGSRVLIIDEPFASLDGDASRLVADAIQAHRTAGGVAVISGHTASTSLRGPTRTVELRGWSMTRQMAPV
ncbi:MAG: heme ABC exporter ATP-binding protein CcmA [Candidatus Limnocylindria bacterium]